jgi:hypothetical protein
LLPIEYANVEELLVNAQRELARQDSLSIDERNYRHANHLFAQTKNAALRLKQRTIERRAEVERMVVPEMQMLMTSVQMIEAAGLYQVDMLDEAIDEAAEAYRKGDYIDALILIRDAQADADRILRPEDAFGPEV